MIRRQGFTLAEAMITMVIISLVMAATMPIVLKSQNAPSEAPFKYVTQGKLVQNAAVYSALGATSTVLLGDKRVPIDSNITANIDYVFASKINPKLSIVTRSKTSNPLISRHLIDFYEKDDSSNYLSIGKISYDRFFNMALGTNAMDSIDADQTLDQVSTSEEPTWPNLKTDTDTWTYKSTTLAATEITPFKDIKGGDTPTSKGAANTAIGQYSMGGDARYLGATATDGTGDSPTRNLTGTGNTALGAFSLKGLRTGRLNTAVGLYALQSPSANLAGTAYTATDVGTGHFNTALGAYALKYNYKGNGNTSLGTFSMTNNEKGNYNTAVGMYALYSNREAEFNTAIGYRALSCLNSESITGDTTGKTATGNTAVGYLSGSIINAGEFNTSLGYQSLAHHANGSYNIGLGVNALRGDIDVSTKNNSGSYNIAVGTNSLLRNTDGYGNIVIGHNSLLANNGNGNIVIGNYIELPASVSETSATTTYSNKLYIGGLVSGYAASTGLTVGNSEASSVLLYGDMTAPAGSNALPSFNINAKKITIGRASISGAADWSTNSEFIVDTVKTTIGKDSNSQTFLKGPTYIGTVAQTNSKVATIGDVQNIIDKAWVNVSSTTYSVNHGDISSLTLYSDARLKNITGDNTAGLKEIMQLQVKNYTMKNDKSKEPMVGVIAQDLQKIFPNSVKEGRDGYLRIKRDEIFYACVNAIKELANKIQDILAKITGLEEKIRILEDRNKLNEEKINALEQQNKLFEERLTALEGKSAKKSADKKMTKKQEEQTVSSQQEEKK